MNATSDLTRFGQLFRRRTLAGLAAVTFFVATVACSSNSSTLTGPSPSKCDLSLALETGSIAATGGSGQLKIATTPECAWTATTQATWLTGLSSTSGQGSGEIEFRVAPNAEASPREGDVVVNSQRVVVRQEAAACSFAVSPATIEVGAGGGLGSATLTTLTGCAWTVATDAGWVTVAPLTGSGSGTLNFAFPANDGGGRSATVRVADQVITVRQNGRSSGCTYAVTPASQAIGISGGAGGPIQVSAGAGCAWTASSNASWIRITDGASGSGSGAVSYVAEANNGSARTGTLTVVGQTVTVTQAGSGGCSFSVSPSTQRVDSAGGVAPSIVISTAAGCAWNAAGNVDWLNILNGSSGSGSGMVTYQVSSNAGPERIATLTIAGHAVTVTQSAAPCSYDVTPATVTSPAAGGEGTPIALTTSAACEWSASSDVSWITVTTPRGTGSTSIRYAVAANTGGERRGVITVAGRTIQVTQAAAAASCSYAVDPTAVAMNAAGGGQSVGVTTAANCAWTAASSASWITITSAATASGPGTVTFNVAANSGSARSGVVTIAGQTVTVTQAQAQGPSCTSTIAPTGESAAALGATGSVSVTVASGCAWTAASNVEWITVTSGSSGTGTGSVSYVVSPNTGAARTGTLTIAGQTFTVNQAAAALECTYSIDPLSYRPEGAAGPGIPVTVTTSPTCAWTATANDDWITITSGASGIGPGTVTFSLTRNTGNRRQGTITIAGQIFTISQARD